MDKLGQAMLKMPVEGWILLVLMSILVFVGYRYGDRIEQYLEFQKKEMNQCGS